MITLLSKERFIVPRTVEVALRRPVWNDKLDEPGAAAREGGVVVDLSHAEWVDVSALVQLVLLVDALLRHHVSVHVVLPEIGVRPGEQEFLNSRATANTAEQLRRRVARRERTRSVITHLRFMEALQEAARRWEATSFLIVDARSHVQPAEEDDVPSGAPGGFTEGDSAESVEDTRADDDLAGMNRTIERELPRNYEMDSDFRFMSQLRWMSVDDVEAVRSFAGEFTRLLADRRRGLQPIHAQALANVIFHELLDNVKQHSKHTTHAMVVAWARPTTRTLIPSAYVDHEQSFAEWVRANDTPMLEIVVGDSGQGLHKSLRAAFDANAASYTGSSFGRVDADVLAWAWDRWSSSRYLVNRRGTRGLYRVDRIVSMHQGLATVRAGRESVGWDHGGVGFDKLISPERRMGAAPGTIARLLLPVIPVERGTPRAGSLPSSDLEIRFLNAGVCSREGLSDLQKRKIRDALRLAAPEQPGCVVVQFEESPDVDVIKALRDAAELRHPSLLVLAGLTPDASELRTAIDTLTQELTKERWFDETRDPKAHAVWDPILVLSPTGELLWAAASELHARVLNSLLGTASHHISATEVARLIPDRTQRNDTYRRLRHDRATVELGPHGSVRLRVTVGTLISAARGNVERQISTAIRGRKGRAVLTPSLRFTRAWIRFGKAVWDSGTHDFALWGLAASYEKPATISEEIPILLGDANADMRVLERLAAFLGCSRAVRLPHYAAFEIVEGVRLLEASQNVIIHTDVVVSGESVRRCLAQILRDGATPVAVTCFADARHDPMLPIQMETEEGLTELRVFSITHAPQIHGELTPPGPFDVVSPLTGSIESESPAESLDGLREALIADGAASGERDLIDPLATGLLGKGVVHFTHLMRPNGRHFTVWINHQKLLRLAAIREAMLRAVRSWLDRLGEGLPLGCEVWYPVAAGSRESPLRDISTWLMAQDERIVHHRGVPRIPVAGRWIFPMVDAVPRTRVPVLVIDWGALDGSTVLSMVDFAARAGASDVFACVVLSQLAPEVRRFLEGLDAVRVEVPEEGVEQLDLLGGKARIGTRVHTAQVRVRFLATFTSGSFHRISCPVCTRIQKLRSLRPNDGLMQQVLQKKIHHRMRPRVEEELAPSAPVGVDGRPLDPTELDWILRWRDALDHALGRTGVRYAVAREIEGLLERTGLEEADQTRTRALFHLLSVESQWLKLPPLDFAPMRQAVAKLATRVALAEGEPLVVRLHAIIVLRIADKRGFVANLRELFTACAAHPELMEQLLFATFSYAARDHNARPKRLEAVRDTLHRIENELGRTLKLSPEIERSTRNLAGFVRLRHGITSQGKLPQIHAWNLLRDQMLLKGEIFNVAREAFEALSPDRSHLSGLVSAAARGRDAVLNKVPLAWIEALETRWLTVRGWIQEQLLALSNPLLPLIKARALALSPEVAAWIEGQIQHGGPLNDGLPRAIDAILQTPRMPPSQAVWDRYLTAWNWWNQNLIGLEGPSVFAKWIAQSPASVDAAVAEVRRRLDEENVPCDLVSPTGVRHRVFCTQSLLNQVLSDLAVHVQDELAARGNERHSVRIEVLIPEERPAGRIVVLLKGSRVGAGTAVTRSAEPPSGLDQYREDLGLFGGTITYDRTAAGDLGFTLILQQQDE